jgi:hypothetical protein
MDRSGPSNERDDLLQTADVPDVSSLTWRFDHSNTSYVRYEGKRFVCSEGRSPDGSWRIAFGRADGADRCRVFGFRGEELAYTFPLVRPSEAWISDTGVAVVVDSEGFDSQGGSCLVVDSDGSELLADSFDANVDGASVSTDGAYAAVVTLNPDNCLYLYDLESGERTVRHEIEHGRRHGVSLRRSDGSMVAYLVDEGSGRLLYAVDSRGTIVWENDRIRSSASLFRRVLSRIR